ncbi:GekBS024P [Symbiodinium pilosum]|uniref:GekBS024P protein n=1 Tax=Symbiodinium pilosum TaxID=2952 RepID=A0A812T1T5_SYMPI|nr:GekBS024P [Symbiodinium pilosum]
MAAPSARLGKVKKQHFAHGMTRRLAIRPSTVPYCPDGYKDCGSCRCVPEATCSWCPGGLHQAIPEPIESTVPGCHPDYVDCGDCMCVPRSTCEWCGSGLGDGNESEGNNTPGHNITMRPSLVPYCPESHVDCGTCLCVAESTCQWCPTPFRPTLALPAPSDNVTMRPSMILGCPDSHVDCGACACPLAVAGSLSRGGVRVQLHPQRIAALSRGPLKCLSVRKAMSTVVRAFAYNGSGLRLIVECFCYLCVCAIIYLPLVSRKWSYKPSATKFYVDCGTCRCVSETTCQWCPGAGTPQPLPPPPRRPKQPSQVTGCPAAFFDCGTCHCVPEHTCRWCPGWDEEPPLLTTTAPVTVSSTQAPPSSSLSLSTSGSPGFCPAGFTFCDDSGCVWGLSCSDYGYGWRSQETQDPASEGKVLVILNFCLHVTCLADIRCPVMAEPGCFDQEFTCERCCDTRAIPVGDLSCWMGDIRFATCCGLTKLRFQATAMLPAMDHLAGPATCPPNAQAHCFDSYFPCERCCDTRRGGQGDLACWPDTTPMGLRTLSYNFCCGLMPFASNERIPW